MAKKPDDEFSPEEAARRRDEVIRRMANTPPRPRTKSPGPRRKMKKPTVVDQAAPQTAADDTDA